ncbi:hypothetical protein DY000_02058996 [Brassica cretica]|uniref:Uncharacterized protein n=1 Tax=Brassica cretica TaxID=69181 RepID=A0ABQ7B2L6_BRACR|nr:hypothetical protein DY000_02058996 [Brassica cretica]
MGTVEQVLGHPAVGGFWSHCEWNSSLESIVVEGVPMICRPFGADLRDRSIGFREKLKASVRVEGSSYNALDELVKFLETS